MAPPMNGLGHPPDVTAPLAFTETGVTSVRIDSRAMDAWNVQ